MKINCQGLRLLKGFEGLRLKSYQDQKGVWTIGYGHTKDVRRGQIITESKAYEYLKEDLIVFEMGVGEASKVSLNENEFSALVSFSFNVGLEGFRKSRLLYFLNKDEKSVAANQFLKWTFIGLEESPGILKRRQAEKALFMKPPRLVGY